MKVTCICDLCKYGDKNLKCCYKVGIDKCYKNGVYKYFEMKNEDNKQ